MARKRKKAKVEEKQNPEVAETVEEETPTEESEATETVEAEVVEEDIADDAELEEAAVESEEVEEEPVDAETEPASQLEEELQAARQEAGQNLENWQRTAAELANYKRRQEEQMKLQRDRIKSEVLEGVISALDDLDLAFQNLPEELDGQVVGWVEGFRLVQRKLDKILDDQNVMPINTEGTFDPNFHEAVSYEPHNDHKTDEIIAELRRGYQIGNRVIRPALVRVAS